MPTKAKRLGAPCPTSKRSRGMRSRKQQTRITRTLVHKRSLEEIVRPTHCHFGETADRDLPMKKRRPTCAQVRTNSLKREYKIFIFQMLSKCNYNPSLRKVSRNLLACFQQQGLDRCEDASVVKGTWLLAWYYLFGKRALEKCIRRESRAGNQYDCNVARMRPFR